MRQQKIAMIAAGHVKKTRLSSEMEFRHGVGGGRGVKRGSIMKWKKKRLFCNY